MSAYIPLLPLITLSITTLQFESKKILITAYWACPVAPACIPLLPIVTLSITTLQFQSKKILITAYYIGLALLCMPIYRYYPLLHFWTELWFIWFMSFSYSCLLHNVGLLMLPYIPLLPLFTLLIWTLVPLIYEFSYSGLLHEVGLLILPYIPLLPLITLLIWTLVTVIYEFFLFRLITWDWLLSLIHISEPTRPY